MLRHKSETKLLVTQPKVLKAKLPKDMTFTFIFVAPLGARASHVEVLPKNNF